VHFEATSQSVDGSLHYVDCSIRPVTDDAGNVIFLIPEGRDITGSKQAEEALKAGEVNYRHLFQQNPAPMLIYENDSLQLLAVNDAFESHYGYTSAEIRQMRLTDLYPEDERGPVTALTADLALKSHSYAGEWHHRKSDGTLIDIDVRSHSISYEGRAGRIVVITDITGQKLALEALRESEAKFRSIIESSPVGYHIYKLEADGRLVFSMFNRAADTILHVSHEPFIGLDILAAFPALAGTGIPEMYTAVARGELGMQDFEAPYDYAGISGVYDVRVFRGAQDQTVVNFFDITERKLAEEKQARLTEQLHQSQKMDAIGQLAGGVAHDFNNLLAGIMGSAQMLQFAENLSEKQKKYLSIIITASERAGNLSKKLLTFSRTGNKVSTAVDCVKIINDTVEILQHSIDKNITIAMENRAVQTSIIGDDSMLQNALMNIAINSSHSMPHGGTLTFTIDNVDLDSNYCEVSPFKITPGKYLEIAVRDTGTGMAPEVVSRIFEPFFTTKEHGKGTGLGLAMVYGTVQEHGGAVTVYSELGTGTVFYIYLPVTEELMSIKVKSETFPKGTGTVLLIDDEELIRITAKGLLESLGYKVLTAENGDEGIKSFIMRKDEINLIVLDMIMPVMGGREAFKKLREIDPAVPVLIASGFAREEHMVLLKEQGVSGFLQKPFRISELAEKVHQALEQ
jgi:PAS domain S-box-containing protein